MKYSAGTKLDDLRYACSVNQCHQIFTSMLTINLGLQIIKVYSTAQYGFMGNYSSASNINFNYPLFICKRQYRFLNMYIATLKCLLMLHGNSCLQLHVGVMSEEITPNSNCPSIVQFQFEPSSKILLSVISIWDRVIVSPTATSQQKAATQR